MKIDRQLSLVIPVESDGGTVYVHSAAISRQMFEKFFKVIAKTYTNIFQEGAAFIAGAGPKVAALMLQSVAEEMGMKEKVNSELLLEVKRLCNVACMGTDGWETIPLTIAINRGFFDQEALSDVEGQIVFFILCSAMTSKKDLPGILETMAGFWGSQTVSSTCTEFAASLPILMQDENSGKNKELLQAA